MTTYAILNSAFFATKPSWMPAKLYQAICYRANPRSEQYMINLLAQEFPNTTIVEANAIPADTKTIVLLYRDAIGIGYSTLEGKLIRNTKLVALTGRRRKFTLTKTQHFKLWIKRILEVTLLPELIFAPILLVGATLLAVKDQLLGYTNDK